MPSLEDELFELVFEGLDEDAVSSLAFALTGSDIQPPSAQEGLREITLESLPIAPSVSLGNVHLRIIRYDGTVFDLELNFRLRECSAPSYDALVEALYDFAADLAKTYDVDSYYAGLEPASDEGTRMFTGSEKGPYFRDS